MHLSVALLGWPSNLTNEESLTDATWALVIATFLLVLATVIMYFDSRSKGKEQRKRWEREDASRVAEQRARWEREDLLRTEDAKPKAVVDIAKREPSAEIVFLCFNLGETIFFVDQMIVTVTGGSVQTSNLMGVHVLLPGTFISTSLDCKDLVKDGFQEANVVFVLEGSHGRVNTNSVWFYFYPDPGEAVGYGWRVGRLSDRMPGMLIQGPRSIPDL